MAKISARGNELGRKLTNGYQLAYFDDGVVLCRSLVFGGGWKRYAKKKADVPLSTWVANKKAMLDALPKWAKVKNVPSVATLEKWSNGGVCKTPTGEVVEPDGTGTDGAPSWLLLTGMI